MSETPKFDSLDRATQRAILRIVGTEEAGKPAEALATGYLDPENRIARGMVDDEVENPSRSIVKQVLARRDRGSQDEGLGCP